MVRSSRLATATATAAVVVLAGSAVALAAGTPTPDAPPRIAFVAHAFNPADALAVGPIAGQLGAPVFTTSPDALSEAAATGLDAYNPELVLVAGGPGAIEDPVLDEIRTATGLTGDDVDRVFGVDRTETAAALAKLFEDRGIDPAFLPVEATATDSDLLDGMDSTDFEPAGDYQPAGDYLAADGSVPLTGDLGYAQPQERHLYVHHDEFVATSGNDEDRNMLVSSFNTGITDTLRHPVHLPAGAVVTGLEARVVDGDAVDDLRVNLQVVERHGGSNSQVAELVTSGDAGTEVLSTTDIHPSFAELNPDVHQYVLLAHPEGNVQWPNVMGIYWVKITYTIQAVQ